MPFRKRYAPRRYTGRRSFGFRRPGTRLVTPTRKWETALLTVDEQTQLTNTSDFRTIIYTHLASIPLSLNSLVTAGPENRIGTAMASMERSLEIGGIVIDWDITLDQVIDGEPTVLNDGLFWSCFQLVTDRVDAKADGSMAPASIDTYDPFRTTFPMAILTASNPDVLQKENRMPTRIHWSKTTSHYAASIPILNSETLASTWSQRVSLQPPTLNKRLRIRLDDDQGLFCTWAFRQNTSPDATQAAFVVRRWLRGQLYYRFRR